MWRLQYATYAFDKLLAVVTDNSARKLDLAEAANGNNCQIGPASTKRWQGKETHQIFLYIC